MWKRPSLRQRALLPALLSMLLLSACAGTVRIATPDPDRAARVETPAVPDGEAQCGAARCLSDRESAALLANYAAALDAANGRLDWLRDWINEARKPRRARKGF